MRIKAIEILILLTTLGCSTSRQDQTSKIQSVEKQIKCSLELNKDSFQIGEQMEIFFVIENIGNQPIFTSNSPYNSYYIDGVRSKDGYDVLITTQKGIELNEITKIDVKSGRFGITKIEPQEHLKIRIHDMNKYDVTSKQGTYYLKIDKRFYVYTNKKSNREYYENEPSDFKEETLISKTERIEVKVL